MAVTIVITLAVLWWIYWKLWGRERSLGKLARITHEKVCDSPYYATAELEPGMRVGIRTGAEVKPATVLEPPYAKPPTEFQEGGDSYYVRIRYDDGTESDAFCGLDCNRPTNYILIPLEKRAEVAADRRRRLPLPTVWRVESVGRGGGYGWDSYKYDSF